MPFYQLGRGVLSIKRQPVYKSHANMIVNAANEGMRGGGGLDGAIHHHAGVGLLEELKKVAPNGSPTGIPVLTGTHLLPQKYIAHVAGPRWSSENEEACSDKLKQCYQNVMRMGNGLFLNSISFPSISTGIFGYPIEKASDVALEIITTYLLSCDDPDVRTIEISLFTDEEFWVYANKANALLGRPTAI